MRTSPLWNAERNGIRVHSTSGFRSAYHKPPTAAEVPILLCDRRWLQPVYPLGWHTRTSLPYLATRFCGHRALFRRDLCSVFCPLGYVLLLNSPRGNGVPRNWNWVGKCPTQRRDLHDVARNRHLGGGRRD